MTELTEGLVVGELYHIPMGSKLWLLLMTQTNVLGNRKWKYMFASSQTGNLGVLREIVTFLFHSNSSFNFVFVLRTQCPPHLKL